MLVRFFAKENNINYHQEKFELTIRICVGSTGFALAKFDGGFAVLAIQSISWFKATNAAIETAGAFGGFLHGRHGRHVAEMERGNVERRTETSFQNSTGAKLHFLYE
jgi:hypothetical protein